jgi:hypothetical protein
MEWQTQISVTSATTSTFTLEQAFKVLKAIDNSSGTKQAATYGLRSQMQPKHRSKHTRSRYDSSSSEESDSEDAAQHSHRSTKKLKKSKSAAALQLQLDTAVGLLSKKVDTSMRSANEAMSTNLHQMNTQMAAAFMQQKQTSFASPPATTITPNQCMSCGQEGHWMHECPKLAHLKLQRVDPTPRAAQDVCFLCKQEGHYANACPNRGQAKQATGRGPICFTCQTPGHVWRMCPNKATVALPASFPNAWGRPPLPKGQPPSQPSHGAVGRSAPWPGSPCPRCPNNPVHRLKDCPLYPGCGKCGKKNHLTGSIRCT